MNFLNIGTAELLLIFVIALIVVGPRRLPEIVRNLGKIMNDLRKMSQEFTTQITQELESPAKELAEVKRELEAPIKELGEITQELEAPIKELGEITQELEAPAKESEAKGEAKDQVKGETDGTEDEAREIADQSVSEEASKGDQD
jgi:sec-independent protein translocase protein TatB